MGKSIHHKWVKISLPVSQSVPSYPVSVQSQVKDPGVSVHAPTPLQVEGLLHSFISKTSKHIVKPVLSDHVKQDIFGFSDRCCLLLYESSAENSSISNHLPIAIYMSPEWMVA